MVQREKIRSELKEDKRFESEDGAGVMHWHKGARWVRLSSGSIQARKSKEEATGFVGMGSPEETWMQHGGQLQE